MKKKRMITIFIIFIFVLHLLSPLSISIQNEKLIDEDFMKNIRRDLTEIIKESQYWQGRYFGTEGEIKASVILFNYLKNIIPEIQYDDLLPKYRKKLGIHSPDDISLTIGKDLIPDSEIFPMFTPSYKEKLYHFENAKIIIPPPGFYNFNFNKLLDTPNFTNNENHIYLIFLSDLKSDYDIYNTVLKLFLITKLLPSWPVANGYLCADYNKNTYFMPPTSNNIHHLMSILPGFMINGSLGNNLINNNSQNIDFKIKQYVQKDFQSRNVIATIPGKSDDIIFIGSKLDSMPCQGAADDSGSISVVWGLAKYFAENRIELNHTLKFGAWAGEEFLRLGSKSYIETHPNENIRYYIGLGAIGYKNNSNTKKSDLHLNIHSYRAIQDDFFDYISSFAYHEKSKGYGKIIFKVNDPMLFTTDAGSFVNHVSENIFSIDKGNFQTATHWYHRSGENHTCGDILDILDEQDIKATADLLIDMIKYLDSKQDLYE